MSHVESPRMTATAKKAPNPKKRNGREGAAVRERGINAIDNHAAAMTDPDMPLTDMQRAFVLHHAAGESITTAMVKAGFAQGSLGMGYRLIHMPKIQIALAEERRKVEEASGMTRKRVLDGLIEAIELAKMVEEPSSMIAGWREIGKMCGYYEPTQLKVTHTHEGKVLHERVERMSDDELFKLIEERANAIRSLPAPSTTAADQDAQSGGGGS